MDSAWEKIPSDFGRMSRITKTIVADISVLNMPLHNARKKGKNQLKSL